MSKFIFVYPDVTDPEATKVSLPYGFGGNEDVAKAAAWNLIENYGYTRVMLLKTDGEAIAVVADYRKEPITVREAKLGDMVRVV